MRNEYDLLPGEYYLFHRLIRLSQLHCTRPLVKIVGEIKDISSMRFTEVMITDLGTEVLSGRLNNIDLNGIDEQIGGVHLCSKNNTADWFYSDGTLIKKS